MADVRWCAKVTMTTVHVYPLNDLVEHDTDGDDCICGPTTEPVEREDGSIGWVVTHHSLDGREHHKPDGLHAAPPDGGESGPLDA